MKKSILAFFIFLVTLLGVLGFSSCNDNSSVKYIYTNSQGEVQRLEKERSAPKTEAEVSAVHSPMPKAESRDIEAPSVKSASGKYCKTCGSLNAEGAKFCFSCSGTEFSQSAVKYCVSCEHTNPINAKFCDSCGGKEFAFTGDELRGKISAKRAKEEAERIARYYVIDNGTLKTLKDKNIRAADIPKNVTAIAKNVFADCKMLESVIIPEGVTSIGYEAFARCEKLTEIVIPSSVKTIEARAFAVCKSLTKATLPEGLTELDSTFCDSAALSEVNIPSTVKRINRAFENCHSLKRIKLPAGLEHIGKSAFENCTSLEECNLPEGLKSIGYRAFFASSKLKEMRLPNSLTELGEYSFERTSIQNVTVPKGIKVIPTKCFGDCPNLESVRILGAETIKGQAFAGNARLKSLELSDTLKCIENLAFLGCSALSDVRFVPNSSRELKIDINAFKDCNKLSDSSKAQIMKNVNAGGRVPFAVSGTKVTGLKPEYAFLTDITIPSDITEIGINAFKDCANIVSVVIEEGVKTIGINAFRHCDNLKSIRIPASVTSISSSAFDECPRLESIVIDSKNTKYAMIDKCLVEDYTSTRYSVLLRAFRGFKIPSTVAAIASNAFLNTEAEKVVIPRLVNTLWAHAFGGCNKLSSVSFECTEGWVDTGKKLFGKISSKTLANPFQAAELLKVQENAWERK